MQSIISFLAWAGLMLGSILYVPQVDPAPIAAASQAPVVASSVVLPVQNFGRVLVDPSHSHVFVSSPASNEIVVLDFDGNVVKQIQGEAGADAMVVDGTTLYVTLLTAGAIDEIDTASLIRIKTLATGLISPNDLVMAGGRLWSTSGNCGSWSVQLVSIDVVSGATKTFQAPGSMNYCAAFAPVNPKRPNVIIGWSLGLSSATVTTLDTSSNKPVVLKSSREELLGNLQDVAITPDGKGWIAASGAPYNFPEFSVATLTQDGVVYPAKNYPTAVAVNSERGIMVGGLSNPYATNLYEYAIGAPQVALLTNSNGREVAGRGLAFSPDGRRIFELTWDHVGAVTFNLLPAS